jgi:hypothetical protein
MADAWRERRPGIGDTGRSHGIRRLILRHLPYLLLLSTLLLFWLAVARGPLRAESDKGVDAVRISATVREADGRASVAQW